MNLEFKMENGKWKMDDGKWKMEDGRWKIENGKWKMVEMQVGKAGSRFLMLSANYAN